MISNTNRAHLELVQTFEQAQSGYFDYGPKRVFRWAIEPRYSGYETSQVGSWQANHYFRVATGQSDRATLGNARRALAYRARRAGQACTFAYEEVQGW